MPIPPDLPGIGKRRVRRALLAAAALWLAVGGAHAQTSALRPAGPSADSVKAAYLLKFLNYVEWPAAVFAGEDAPYVIGVADDEGVLAELQRQAPGHSVNRRHVQVRRLGVAADMPPGLHLLYIGSAIDRGRLTSLLRATRGAPALVVTDTDGALDLGSMINFKVVGDRVRFEVALDPVRRSGLQLNSRLLSVAIAVNKGTGQ